jgi:hypothetical protein
MGIGQTVVADTIRYMHFHFPTAFVAALIFLVFLSGRECAGLSHVTLGANATNERATYNLHSRQSAFTAVSLCLFGWLKEPLIQKQLKVASVHGAALSIWER